MTNVNNLTVFGLTKQQSLESFKGILDAFPMHICILNELGVIVEVNDKWKEFAIRNNFKGENFGIGSNYLEICEKTTGEFSDLAREVADGCRNVISGKITSFETEYSCHSDKEKRWFKLTATPLMQQRYARVLVMHTNVTERTLVKHRFQSLIENISDGITLLDKEGIILYSSPSKQRILGYSLMENTSTNVFDLIHKDDRKTMAKRFSRLVDKPGLSVDIQLRVPHKSGSWRWLEGTATNLLSDVSVGAIVINYRDVTERKQTEIESQVISEIIQGATRTSNLDELFSLIHRSLKKVLSAENCFIALYDQKTEMLNLPFFVDQREPAPKPFKMSTQKTAYVFNSGRPMLFNRKTMEEILVHEEETELSQTNAAAWLGVPLRTPNEVIGVLVVQHYEDENAYSQRELDFLTSVGNQVALIIERRMVEEAVQNSYDHLDAIINAVPDPIFVKNKDHKWVLLNTAMCLMMGRFPEEVIGKSDYDFFPEDEASVFWTRDEKVFVSGKDDINEEFFTDAEGNRRTNLTRRSLYIEENNEPFIVGVIRDITDRKLWEFELNKTKKFLQTVIDTVPNLIFVKNSEGRFTLVNQAYADFHGLAFSNIIGKTTLDLIKNDEELKIIEDDEQKALRKPHETTSLEHKITDSKGNSRWFHTVRRAFVVAGENTPSILGIATDLTERRILENQLRHSQKMESIGQLAAGIAHEINTPTQYVGDNTRFIRDAFKDLDAVLKKYDRLLATSRLGQVENELITELEEAISAADIDYLREEVPRAIQQSLDGVTRIAKIVQSMKDFAHPGTEDKKASDLNRAIESTVTVARNEWKYVAQLETNFDETLPPVPCFLGEFNQVILNMVVNAAQAISLVVGDGMKGKGKIKITTKKIGDEWAEIQIEDTGAGIPSEIQGRIFDPFFTTKEVGRGTGQGLAISHSVIVEKHHGQLSFETEVGKGTTFVIRIPLNER